MASEKMVSINTEANNTQLLDPELGTPPPLGPGMPDKNQSWFDHLKGTVTAPVTATFAYLFVCMYINCVVQVYAEYRAQELLTFNVDFHLYDSNGDALTDATSYKASINGGEMQDLASPDFTATVHMKPKILPDIGFDALPDIDPLWADVMVYFAMLMTMVRFLFGVTDDNKRIRRHIFRRHIFNLGTLFILRAFAIISTMLPNPLESCKPVVTGSPWVEAFNILNGSVVTCADVMYSGHTVNITLCAMTWHCYSHVVPLTSFDPLFEKFGRVSNKLGDLERITTIKLCIWVFAFVGYICIIGSRFHYTLDVFIGMILTVATFKYHQLMIRTCHLKDTWFNKIISWSETDASDLQAYRKNLSEVNSVRNSSMTGAAGSASNGSGGL
jgi:hypothetical protein